MSNEEWADFDAAEIADQKRQQAEEQAAEELAAVYTRVASRGPLESVAQEVEGELGLDVQKQLLQEYVERRGFEIMSKRSRLRWVPYGVIEIMAVFARHHDRQLELVAELRRRRAA
jgi:hypothetical protein